MASSPSLRNATQSRRSKQQNAQPLFPGRLQKGDLRNLRRSHRTAPRKTTLKTNSHTGSPAASQIEEVVVRLSSGLGNQLFQLAHGLWLARERDASLKFDTIWFQLVSGIHPVRRQLRLNEFMVDLPEAFRGARRLLVGLLAAVYDKYGRGGRALSELGKMCIVQEGAEDGNNMATLSDGVDHRCYLNGYWQTGRAFLAVREQLLPMLVPKHPLSPGAEKYIAQAGSGPTGFVHVRRGDYMHFMGEAGLLPPSYYAQALPMFDVAGTHIARWLVFSEDLAWSKENLQFIPNAEFVDYLSPRRDIEDLMIMKECSAGIIANSSYSWWGAALGERHNRLIIAPDRYRQNATSADSEWALPSWKQIKAWA